MDASEDAGACDASGDLRDAAFEDWRKAVTSARPIRKDDRNRLPVCGRGKKTAFGRRRAFLSATSDVALDYLLL
tara:strand:+ start:445 stop:666 length:222 start_codon:yes stop_codon:yes gene_type:complete